MQAQSDKTSALPPYLSYISFMTFLDSLSQGVPSRIDHTIMRTMSGTQQSQMKHALRYLQLIDAYGNTNENFNALVEADEFQRKQLLNHVVRSAYAFLFVESFVLTRATMGQLEEKFRNVGASGDTVRKCVTFFTNIAQNAGIDLSPFVLNQPAPRSTATKTRDANSPRSKTKASRGKATSTAGRKSESARTVTPPPSPASNWSHQLLGKFPSFDPAWPDEVKTQWFESFRQLMDMGGGYTTHASGSDEETGDEEDEAMAA